jgi:hypothetical protein
VLVLQTFIPTRSPGSNPGGEWRNSSDLRNCEQRLCCAQGKRRAWRWGRHTKIALRSLGSDAIRTSRRVLNTKTLRHLRTRRQQSQFLGTSPRLPIPQSSVLPSTGACSFVHPVLFSEW